MKMSKRTILGLSIKTCNRENQAQHDIALLWDRFMKGDIAGQIPDKCSNDIIAVYTNYEGDYMDPYEYILGCEVASCDEVPEGLVKCEIEEGEYANFMAKGKMPQALIVKWGEIWSTDLKRHYRTDFEIYGERSQNPENGEVDIYIGLA